ncbi:MAG: hypothetical protein JWN70_6955 [Planctomycetaceae bacterium]|nr:hypothetical protein [Planctomycetaceae bacterium]
MHLVVPLSNMAPSRIVAWLICFSLSMVQRVDAQQSTPPKPAISAVQRLSLPSAAETELPYNQLPISYLQTTPRDPVTKLLQRLERKEVTLEKSGSSGVLKHLLRELRVPVSSQLLVFSKSSAQAKLITPATPRAVYFNDDVYVGWVPGSSLIEISAADPDLGGTFYSLLQPEGGEVQLRRDESCLLCHLTRSTLRVPGHLVRSFTTDSLGNLQTGWSRITHATAYEERWAGWYVTGPADSLQHLGNVFGTSSKPGQKLSAPPGPFNIAKACDLKDYLSAESDVLPHLVLDHQAHGHNLITRLNYEARLKKPITALEPLVRYLLFLDEASLSAPVVGKADYRRWFEEQGPRDPAQRSLREFDLQTRLFKYRLSYLVSSPAFAALPDQPRAAVWQRIKEVLTTTATNSQPTVIPPAERHAILEIVRATVKGLPEGW